MAAFKQFNTNEVVLTPFYANKSFHYSGDQVTASGDGIEYYQCTEGVDYISGSYSTGFNTILDGVLVFNSIKQLYYSNYLTASTGDSVSTSSLVLGINESFNEFVGNTTGPRFDNFLQSSLTQSRYFSQFSASTATDGPSVISIPSKLYGEKIPCGTFRFEYTSSENFTRSLVTDDGEGNLFAYYNEGTTGEKVGDIFYSQGIAVITGPDSGSLRSVARLLQDPNNSNNINSSSLQFSSSITIKENQYKCVIRDNEYSFTLNPSALKPSGQLSTLANQLSGSIVDSIGASNYQNDGNAGTYEITYRKQTSGDPGVGGKANVTVESDGTISDITTSEPGHGYIPNQLIKFNAANFITGGTGTVTIKLSTTDLSNISNPENQNQTYYDFATGSYFSPYVTTIGLYNNAYQLVAVGKLANPTPISLNTDTTFVVNFDTW